MKLSRRPNIAVLEGRRDVRGLIKALRHEDDSLRRDAADALRRIRDPQAVEPLTRLLHDRDSMVRDSVVGALAAIKDARAVGPLIDCLSERGSGSIESGAARALADIGDPRAVEPLLADPRFHTSAARLLVNLRDPRATDVVVERNTIGVMDPETEEIYLREMVEPRVVPALIRGLLNPDGSGVKRNAGALGKLQDPAAVLPLAAAAASLPWKSRGDSPQESKRLREVEYEVLKAIHAIIGHLGESGAVGPLADVLSSEFGWIRDYAAFTLARIATTEAEKLLERLPPHYARDKVMERGARVAQDMAIIAEPPPRTQHGYDTMDEQYMERRWRAHERLADLIQKAG